jgi:SET domain-containing protein
MLDECASQCKNAGMAFECTSRNCTARSSCSNRTLQRGSKYKDQLEVFRTEFTGYGVRSRVPVRARELVLEYVGEHITMESFAESRYSDSDTYFMETDHGFGIDARYVGNLSRFVNHSCDPNLTAQRVVVRGITRVGLVACRDILAGDELTLHYRTTNFPCRCACCR